MKLDDCDCLICIPDDYIPRRTATLISMDYLIQSLRKTLNDDLLHHLLGVRRYVEKGGL